MSEINVYPYNAEVVKQFYATVFFVGDREKTMKWKSGDDMLSAPFIDFVRAMGYEEANGKQEHAQCMIQPIAK